MNLYEQSAITFLVINNFDFFLRRVPVKLLNEQNDTFKTEIGWETRKIPVIY